jgi:hypothetical protein
MEHIIVNVMTNQNKNAEKVEQNKKYLVKIEDRYWVVQKIGETEYTVAYTDKNKKAKMVQTKNKASGENCTGTHYDYHHDCCHVDAVQKLENANENELLAMECDFILYDDKDELQDTLFQSVFEKIYSESQK